MKKALYIGAIAILLVAFVISAFHVGNYFLDSQQQEERFDDLASIVEDARASEAAEATEPEKEDVTGDGNGETKPSMLPGYRQLYEMNSDVVGWIKIAGTKLDYPVMQTPNERDYYLLRDFDGNESVRGCIYAREECDIDRPSDNITLYGHNMKDGSMFASLNAYVDKSAWDYNSLIFFDTLKEYHTYKIFAVFKTTANLGEGFTYHQFVDAQNKEEFDEFISTCKELAFYETGITPEYGDKVICLSTCEYTLENGRLVVAAVRIS